jgi:hypothetical protein
MIPGARILISGRLCLELRPAMRGSLQSAGVSRPPERGKNEQPRQNDVGVEVLISQYLQISYRIVFTVKLKLIVEEVEKWGPN